jgi:hypothetical protein
LDSHFIAIRQLSCPRSALTVGFLILCQVSCCSLVRWENSTFHSRISGRRGARSGADTRVACNSSESSNYLSPRRAIRNNISREIFHSRSRPLNESARDRRSVSRAFERKGERKTKENGVTLQRYGSPKHIEILDNCSARRCA